MIKLSKAFPVRRIAAIAAAVLVAGAATGCNPVSKLTGCKKTDTSVQCNTPKFKKVQ